MEYEGVLLDINFLDIKTKWEEYYFLYRREIFSLGYNFFKDFSYADDLTQEVFLRLYRDMKKGKEIGNVRAWLYKVAIRKCLDIKKSFWYKLFLKKEERDMEISYKLEEKEVFSVLRNSIEKLSKKQRMAVILRFLKEMEIKEISNFMGISESSVKTHLKRGIKNLKNYMEAKNGTY